MPGPGTVTGKFTEIHVVFKIDGTKATVIGIAAPSVEAAGGAKESIKDSQARLEFTNMTALDAMSIGALKGQLIADIKSKDARLTNAQVD